MRSRRLLGVGLGVVCLLVACKEAAPGGREVGISTASETATSEATATAGPTATLTGSPTSGRAPLGVFFDGTTSKPAGDGSWITQCRLEFGDGESVNTCYGSHTYAAGTWVARFTVTDNLGRAASATLTINATGSGSDGGTTDGGTTDGGTGTGGPRAALTGGPTSGPAPLGVYLDGTASRPAGDGSWIAQCRLEFGDGASTSNCYGTHTYAEGTWTARFTAIDNLGRSATATLIIVSGSGTGGGGTDGGTGGGTGGGTDGGTGGGGTDGGTGGTPGTRDGWQFFGRANGGPSQVYGVSSDASGNLWVAGGSEGLFLLQPGATTFQRFTVAQGLTGYNDGTGVKQQAVISVAGGPANTVYVGYQGVSGCVDAFERYNFNTAYQHIWKSGDADRVVFNGTGISVQHYDISSGPGVVADEPQGREKICTILRIAYHAATGSVWFGGNHGVAWGNANNNQQVEHTHPAINGYRQRGDGTWSYTLLTDSYYGVSPLPNGDVFLGGANRGGRFKWGSMGRSFWSADTDLQRNKLDFWPDAVSDNPYPHQRVDDNVSDMAAMTDGSVWIGSWNRGLARWTPTGTQYLRLTSLEPNSRVASLERDPQDGSLWVGFTWGGVSRVKDGRVTDYGAAVLGNSMYSRVPDIQSDVYAGQRRIFVATMGDGGGPAGVWIYTGP